MDIALADVLTIAGAVAAAGLITTLVEVLKRTLPIIGARAWEQALALTFSMILVTLAFVDQHAYSLGSAFSAFVAWLAIAKLATGIHDEATGAPGTFREQS
ncbi:MAG: hypothetical protein V4515_12460 [Chloroflexota bacterium]